jgi:hypothetical protein
MPVTVTVTVRARPGGGGATAGGHARRPRRALPVCSRRHLRPAPCAGPPCAWEPRRTPPPTPAAASPARPRRETAASGG